MDIKKNIKEFENTLADTGCSLIAVSKTKPVELIQSAYEEGLRDFGENKIQEMVEKHEQLPGDIRWHMIGHLQRNKVKYIAPFVHLIHSVDSLKLLQEIEKQGKKAGRTINCLLQVYIASETTKFGLDEQSLIELLTSDEFNSMSHISICGLMGMASNTDDEHAIRKEFKQLSLLFSTIDKKIDHQAVEMRELSMGMSGDYKIAIEEGSTMIRVGSAVFGERNY